ncbi:MAG: DUF1549 domain-containing protein, partial [Planctomycetales bacterium]
MTQSNDDRILDACLGELLGDDSPPDLTDRILLAAEQRRAEQSSRVASLSASSRSRRAMASPRRVRAAVAVSAAALVLGMIGLGLNHLSNQTVPLADNVPPSDNVPPEPSKLTESIASPDQPSVVSPTVVAVDVPSEMNPSASPDQSTIPQPSSPVAVSNPVVQDEPPVADPLAAAATLPRPLADSAVIALLNDRIEDGWRANQVKPSPRTSDAKWCRRVFLDLLGRIPTFEETSSFLADGSPDKRTNLVDRLLHAERYNAEYARNGTTQWMNLLLGRARRDDDSRPVNREGMRRWLRDAFATNMPYDEFARELIAAVGNNTPGEPNFNGAVNFLLDNLQDDQVPAVNKISQLFLGVRAGCAQCHNHPFNGWKQDQFWGLNACLKQAVALRDPNGRWAVLADQDFRGESGSLEQAEIYYQQRNGIMKAAYPAFWGGIPMEPHGLLEETNRRAELARLTAQSRYLREAIVNRAWEHFLGHGFTPLVDDMGPHNKPSHPVL